MHIDELGLGAVPPGLFSGRGSSTATRGLLARLACVGETWELPNGKRPRLMWNIKTRALPDLSTALPSPKRQRIEKQRLSPNVEFAKDSTAVKRRRSDKLQMGRQIKMVAEELNSTLRALRAKDREAERVNRKRKASEALRAELAVKHQALVQEHKESVREARCEKKRAMDLETKTGTLETENAELHQRIRKDTKKISKVEKDNSALRSALLVRGSRTPRQGTPPDILEHDARKLLAENKGLERKNAKLESAKAALGLALETGGRAVSVAVALSEHPERLACPMISLQPEHLETAKRSMNSNNLFFGAVFCSGSFRSPKCPGWFVRENSRGRQREQCEFCAAISGGVRRGAARKHREEASGPSANTGNHIVSANPVLAAKKLERLATELVKSKRCCVRARKRKEVLVTPRSVEAATQAASVFRSAALAMQAMENELGRDVVLFWDSMLNNMARRVERGRGDEALGDRRSDRYPPELMSLSVRILHRCRGNSVYDDLSRIFVLPTSRTLRRRWKSNSTVTGVLHHPIKELAAKVYGKDVAGTRPVLPSHRGLVFTAHDSMTLAKGIYYHPSTGRVLGYEDETFDLGAALAEAKAAVQRSALAGSDEDAAAAAEADLDDTDTSALAAHYLVFYATSCENGALKMPVMKVLKKDLDALALKQHFVELETALNHYQLRTLATIGDSAGENVRFWDTMAEALGT